MPTLVLPNELLAETMRFVRLPSLPPITYKNCCSDVNTPDFFAFRQEWNAFLRRILLSARCVYTFGRPIFKKNMAAKLTNLEKDFSLQWATRINNVEMVKLMLHLGADIDDQNNDYEWTPLHWACHEGDKVMVKLLLENGANVNAKSASHYTPLWLAVRHLDDQYRRFNIKNRHPLLEMLLENGANFGDKRRMAVALDWAKSIGDAKLVDMFTAISAAHGDDQQNEEREMKKRIKRRIRRRMNSNKGELGRGCHPLLKAAFFLQ